MLQQLHGSGKTAVLVERIISKIVNEKIDIDKILVVTFTNAAASEMRQRILDAIYKRLEENPDDEQMIRQTVLMAKSNICTIHSFCLDVIRNNFYEIDVAPNFRIAEQAEIELLKQEVLEEIFEDKYLNEDAEFLKLINTYTGYRGDEPLKDIILRIYRYIQSSPFPQKWLEDAVEEFKTTDTKCDFAKTKWGNILLEAFNDELYSCIAELKSIKRDLSKYIELDKFYKIICTDLEQLELIYANLDLWDKVYNLAQNFKFEKWPVDRKITLEQKEIAKEKRDLVKKKFNKIKDRILIYDSKNANEDIYEMYKILEPLKDLILQFQKEFIKKKKEKNIIDFNDIEHFALDILVKKDENDEFVATDVAKRYKEKFCEIAIDEYQDSNLVQEYILSTISNGNNIFMVGDVKQSIYKFRQARPELFISKYETYKLKQDKKEEDSLKIQLFKNFRSRQNILDITNMVFKNIMSKKLGDIDYNENEFLNLGANYEETSKDTNLKTELHIIDLKQNIEDDEEQVERIEDVVIEAKFVANKIRNLIQSKYKVYDKDKGYRNITYKDIVILLRSTQNLAPIYEKEISNLNLPVFSDTGSQYLDSVEIQTILSLLKIIDNPRQDIPLVTVLRSSIGGFDDNDLIHIKVNSKTTNTKSFYEVLLEAKDNVEDDLKERINNFLENLEIWRRKQEYLSLDELIWQIYLDTGYYNYVSLMPNGILRQANLKMLFDKAKQYETASFKGLFNFINFIDKLKTTNTDMDSAKLIGENEDVIRIMSIHKSKGLEFPVVFLCATKKQFNLMDLNENILLHQDIGLGPKYINYERKIEYNTLAKEAIGYKSKIETISEEMRILYVALTRAKEKLIITGLSKDIKKEIKEKEDLLNMYEEENINFNIVKKYKTYLDWLQLVYLKNKNEIKDILEVDIIEKDEFIASLKNDEKEETKKLQEKMFKNKKERNEKIKALLNWEYKDTLASTIPTKTSVTKIKELKKEITNTIKTSEKKDIKANMSAPKFLSEQLKITSAKKGTLIHLCIQKLNEKEEYNYEKIQGIVKELSKNEIITKQEEESIDVDAILKYTKSTLWQELKQARQICKEKAFYINIPAKEIYTKDVEYDILVQGIIDLYYINKQGELILVDYKTDYVENGKEQELVSKYKEQLLLYKRALEEALNKKVSKMYIYSVGLQKNIEII